MHFQCNLRSDSNHYNQCFIGKGNWSTQRKSHTFVKTLINLILYGCIKSTLINLILHGCIKSTFAKVESIMILWEVHNENEGFSSGNTGYGESIDIIGGTYWKWGFFLRKHTYLPSWINHFENISFPYERWALFNQNWSTSENVVKTNRIKTC